MNAHPKICCDNRLANCPVWSFIPPPDINMRIPRDLLKNVVFIGVKTPSQRIEEIKYIGTAFIVSVPCTVTTGEFHFMVTAKHVVAKIEKKECYVRVNTRDGGSRLIAGVEKIKWHFHPDETWPSDVAVTPFVFNEGLVESLDFKAMPIAAFLTDEKRVEYGIGEGDEVFTVGLFTRHAGIAKNIPIVRMGNIAMVPDEKVHTSLFANMEVYLVESRSIKGISGSPVFIVQQASIMLDEHQIPTGRFRVNFLGLMHGHWDLDPGETADSDDAEEDVADTRKDGPVNMGIAIVVPAKKILETINCNELVKYRADGEAGWVAKKSPTPDVK